MKLIQEVKSWFHYEKKITITQVVITVVLALSFTFSNILVARQIAGPFGLIFAGSTFMYPVTYILSDLISEVYGFRWSRFTAVMSVVCNVFVVVIAQLVIIAPVPAQTDIPIDAFTMVFQTSTRVFIASAIAFFIGDGINDRIFAKMKRKHADSNKGFISRAIISSIGGTVVDLFLFYIIAFAGIFSWKVMLILIFSDFCTKIIYELLFSPLSNFVTKKIQKKENLVLNKEEK